MKNLLAIFLLTLVGCVEAADRPNVVVLLADDLGWQDIGCYGGPVKTPALDELAKNGKRFTNFYSGCAVCSPSRAVLLTGRHHIRAGVYSWIHDASQNSHLLEREVTLAEILKKAGYSTAHVGKWHLGLPTTERDKPTPGEHGFNYWFATWNNAEPSHRNPKNFIRNGEPVGEIEGYSCQIVVDEAIRWLETRPQNEITPFFLNVWFHEPHAPIAAPDEIVNEYQDPNWKPPKQKPNAKRPGPKQDPAAVYSGTIDNTDRAIGRLLKRLPKDTLIIYASDNGSYRDDRTGGLRGRKGQNWEGGIRVPGIFYWPEKIAGGMEIDEPAGLVDVLPTVCGLLGLEKPDGVHLDGTDLTPLLGRGPRADAATFERRQPLYWHLQKSRPIVAIRDGDWSLVADPDYELSTSNMFMEEWIPKIKKGGYTNFQLFNLKTDPNQEANLADKEPERLAKMKAQMQEINASVMADGADWHLK
ncbi:MAG: sulfatase-like hydrolase/transferase [Verrucomicrobiales bacterium]|nr:sulfatase-like hydrolase/transferase [Verrucomicrobiales bacterium]